MDKMLHQSDYSLDKNEEAQNYETNPTKSYNNEK